MANSATILQGMMASSIPDLNTYYDFYIFWGHYKRCVSNTHTLPEVKDIHRDIVNI